MRLKTHLRQCQIPITELMLFHSAMLQMYFRVIILHHDQLNELRTNQEKESYEVDSSYHRPKSANNTEYYVNVLNNNNELHETEDKY